jgi:hypothetical protein
VKVSGLSATVTVAGIDPTDTQTVNGLGGDDALDASAVPAGVLTIALDGGANNDILIGSAGVRSWFSVTSHMRARPPTTRAQAALGAGDSGNGECQRALVHHLGRAHTTHRRWAAAFRTRVAIRRSHANQAALEMCISTRMRSTEDAPYYEYRVG